MPAAATKMPIEDTDATRTFWQVLTPQLKDIFGGTVTLQTMQKLMRLARETDDIEIEMRSDGYIGIFQYAGPDVIFSFETAK